MDRELTIKQENFCIAYVDNGGNGTEAYKTAYNANNSGKKTISIEAHRLIQNPNVTLRIKEIRKQLSESMILTKEEILADLCTEFKTADDIRAKNAVAKTILEYTAEKPAQIQEVTTRRELTQEDIDRLDSMTEEEKKKLLDEAMGF